MKRVIIYIALILSLFLITKTSAQDFLYQDLGKVTFDLPDGNRVCLKAYVTRRPQNTNVKAIINYAYKYELILVSQSKHQGILTSTWLYGTRVGINGTELTLEEYPNGFTILINTNPTVVYQYETNNSNVEFGISWENAVYDPRNIK